MNRKEILKNADSCVSKSRQAEYGSAEENFGKIAEYWTTHLTGRIAGVLSPTDVAVMMVLLKMARHRPDHPHDDNFVDACGYAALAGELHADGN